MKEVVIKTIEELRKTEMNELEITEDIQISIQLRIVDEKVDYPIKIIHKKPNLTSKVQIKLALYGKAKVNLPAEIIVSPGAKNTSSDFKALVYILSPNAQANVTPGLFIHEKNIFAASHGVVIKNIKEKDLYYLRARGIKMEEAKEMVVGL